jgi:uncharacterized protein YhaN
MRVSRLDLLRYGRFTNVSLEFPKAASDVHIIFGPNEAGKSTSLAAIEDLLFGIPHNSPYNFVHDYASMRIGGVLEHDGKLLEVRRRKGHKDTLLAPNESPLPSGDGALIPFLGGADQTFFTRMFSLNHERLAKGGREILEAKDEVGQTLFSAGAGLSGLRERMASLSREADDQWGLRRAGRRKYYNALNALEEADKVTLSCCGDNGALGPPMSVLTHPGTLRQLPWSCDPGATNGSLLCHAASISPRINKADVTVREILDSALRQNFDEISPGI